MKCRNILGVWDGNATRSLRLYELGREEMRGHVIVEVPGSPEGIHLEGKCYTITAFTSNDQ